MSGLLRSSRTLAPHLSARLTARSAGTPLGATRGYASDPNAPPKVNMWEKPTEPGEWKEEQLVLTILGSWAVVIKGAMMYFS
mmetsp:Transcript_18522/g.60326  ORF Transcript_18522/g.60326 Transcript_18522/m.60326 type:complete len:82 (-) Transcript_18522:125-370(-)